MKYFVQVLTIYLLALSLAPCGDGGGGILAIADKIFADEFKLGLDIEQNSDPCEESPCSPFCICSSCYMALEVTKEILLPENLQTIIPRRTPSFIPHFNSSLYSSRIWQPPQLG